MTENRKQERIQLLQQAAPLPPNASPTGAPDATQTLSVSVITRRRNPLDLESLGGRVLSHDEFNAQYAADSADFDAITAFAKEYGLTVDTERTSVPRRTVVLTGTLPQVEQAFGVSLQHFEHESGAKFHRFDGALTVPAELEGRIEAVLGLDTKPVAKPHFRLRQRPAGVAQPHDDSGSFNPPDVAALYNYPTNLTGAGQCIAILELGGGYEDSDITTFFGTLGIAPPTIVVIPVDGGKNVPGGDPTGADGEVALDIQVAGTIASGAKIAVYFSPNTDQGFIDAITTAVHDTTNKPSVLSISWGGPESGWSAQSRTALDNACQSAAALGVTITVASGDNGSSDGGTGNNVDFPASSPHVLACGGTQLNASGGTIQSEVVWDDLGSGGGASGGGVSTAFPLPSWQAKAKVPAATVAGGGRGVPDVAGDAAPETGYNVMVDGNEQVIGGTSAVAPLWAALIALVNQGRAGKGLPGVGFVNPQLYADPSVLNDITSGTNGSFKAGPGWDACTGLGSPKGLAVATLLETGTASGGSGGTTPPGKHKKHEG